MTDAEKEIVKLSILVHLEMALDDTDAFVADRIGNVGESYKTVAVNAMKSNRIHLLKIREILKLLLK